MSAEADEFWNQVRRVAQEVVGRAQFKGTLVCTAYNPKTHAVKGIIQPHGTESGWVPVAAIHVGNGYGILVGPRVGDPQKLDGQVFDIHFDGGDPDTLVAHHRQFSTPETPPEVQSGEMLLMHESGARTLYDKDGNLTHALKSGTKVALSHDDSVTLMHGPSQSTIQIDKDGNHVHDAKGKSVTIKAGGGAVSIDPGQGGSISLGSSQSPMTVQAKALNITGQATLNGKAIATLP